MERESENLFPLSRVLCVRERKKSRISHKKHQSHTHTQGEKRRRSDSLCLRSTAVQKKKRDVEQKVLYSAVKILCSF